MSHEQELATVSFEKIIEDFTKGNEAVDNLNPNVLSCGEAELSPSESALTEFRVEYAKRIREAFCDEKDS